ncbi:DUF397 domain-containing protein [Streptomyces sp. NPDC019396]|uniref:DUF397 domain-containing protein n=1 Tax=Streptomyces sp. NPDC019396 TaxID=3154687 RepID=UPI0033C47557
MFQTAFGYVTAAAFPADQSREVIKDDEPVFEARGDLHTASLEGAAWRKSSYSGGEGECVEIADAPSHGGIAVRDSKNPSGPAIVLAVPAFVTLIDAIQDDALTC